MSRKRGDELREEDTTSDARAERLFLIAGLDPDGDPVDYILGIHRLAREFRERKQQKDELPEGESCTTLPYVPPSLQR